MGPYNYGSTSTLADPNHNPNPNPNPNYNPNPNPYPNPNPNLWVMHVDYYNIWLLRSAKVDSTQIMSY
jgi:hypothetical protein